MGRRTPRGSCTLANFAAIASVGLSLERFLTARLAEAPSVLDNGVASASLVRTSDFEPNRGPNDPAAFSPPALTIFLYRVDFNKAMRSAWSAVGSQEGRARLALDLHYLLTPWAGNAEDEHRILGRALQALDFQPILSGPLLDPSGGWEPNESVQIVMEEISTEAVMRTFDSLPTDYRLSAPYVARVVRIDSQAEPKPPVTEAVGRLRPGGAA